MRSLLRLHGSFGVVHFEDFVKVKMSIGVLYMVSPLSVLIPSLFPECLILLLYSESQSSHMKGFNPLANEWTGCLLIRERFVVQDTVRCHARVSAYSIGCEGTRCCFGTEALTCPCSDNGLLTRISVEHYVFLS